jgi:hypothetical protein
VPRTRASGGFVHELAEFLASSPTAERLLDYRPSKRAQRRAEELLLKQNEGVVSREERQELDEFAHAERLLRLIKAKLRARNGVER